MNKPRPSSRLAAEPPARAVLELINAQDTAVPDAVRRAIPG